MGVDMDISHRYRYQENPNYRPFIDSLIFFIKIAFACSLMAGILSFAYANLPIYHESWIYLPLLISISHACVYYPWGYVVYNMYGRDYFQSHKNPRPRKVMKQKIDWEVLGTLQGEFIGLIMNYCFFGFAYKFAGMKYDFQSASEVYSNYFDFCKLFIWYLFVIWWADLSFFASHIWFHTNPWVYRVIHKKHHSFQYQVGWSAEVKTVTESIIVSITDLLPHLIFGGHIVHMLAWIIVGIVYNIEGHSGYSFFFIRKYGFHDWHHTKNDGNYGIALYLDHLFKTSSKWENWIEDYPKKEEKE